VLYSDANKTVKNSVTKNDCVFLVLKASEVVHCAAFSGSVVIRCKNEEDILSWYLIGGWCSAIPIV